MSSKRKRSRVVQVTDGSWYSIGHGYTHEDCCECGFSHRVDYKLEGGRIYVRYRIDRRRTASNRKKSGVLILRKR